MKNNLTTRGFTLIELIVVISIIAILMAILFPALSAAHDISKLTVSMSNLRQLGAAHATYASEWSGRQWTVTPDDLTLILRRGNEHHYQAIYPKGADDAERFIPSVPLGFDRYGNWHESRRHKLLVPFYNPAGCRTGNYYNYHSRPFNQYVNGKVFDRAFWAPKDYTLESKIMQHWDDPGEWPVGRAFIYNSSYGLSPAAQLNPQVMARDSIGFRRPMSLPAGHRTPNLSSARYPDTKTHMLELLWLQNPPSVRISGQRIPWLFNHGQDSAPATLFYDGHVRLLSVREAMESNQRVIEQGADPLVISNDPVCAGTDLWFESYAYNGQDTISFHIYTADGILGRDTTK